MAKTEEKMQNEMNASVHSIYSQLLNKRQQEREEKKARVQEAKAQAAIEEEEKYTKEDGTKMSKKEKREAALNNWQDIITNLTGDDLEYKSKKKGKKKYRKWIDDEDGNTVITAKPKKVKKKNYNKEFEPELNMLRTLITDQNKFNADLWKRWQLIMGPAAKDSQVPTKTMVEMAAALNAGRSNALSMLNNIGNIKKTIADLTMKQKKLDSELGGTAIADNTDLALLGSNIGASLLGDLSQSINNAVPNTYQAASNDMQPINFNNITTSPGVVQVQQPIVQGVAESFDPNTWAGHSGASNQAYFESIPHTIVVEKNANGDMRFKAVRDDTGEELMGAPVPDYDFSRLNINEKDGVVRGQFDEVYKIENVG